MELVEDRDASLRLAQRLTALAPARVVDAGQVGAGLHEQVGEPEELAEGRGNRLSSPRLDVLKVCQALGGGGELVAQPVDVLDALRDLTSSRSSHRTALA